jgi:hypothetical protein
VALRGLATSWTNSGEPRRTVNDFTGDFVSAKAFIRGGDPYAQTRQLARRYAIGPSNIKLPLGDPHIRNPHPPAYIMLLTPLATLSYVTARNTWLILMTLSVAFAIGTIARASGASLWIAGMVALASLVLPPVVLELRIGEANALILLTLAVAWLQLKKGHSGRAGIALGIGSAIKIYPLFLVIPLIRSRNVKAALAQLATSVVLTLGSGIVLGWRDTFELVSKVMPSNTKYWLTAPNNLSILAIPFRWLTTTRWTPTAANVPTLALGLSTALALFCIAAAATTPTNLSQDLFWGTIPWMLLISPLFWYEYTVLCLPLIYLILSNHVRERRSPRWFVLIAIGCLLIWTFASLPTRSSEPSAALLALFALPTCGLLILGLSEWSRPLPDPLHGFTSMSGATGLGRLRSPAGEHDWIG